MNTTRLFLLSLTSLPIVLYAGAVAAADKKTDAAEIRQEANGLTGMLHAVGKPVIPNLTGLIQPGKMGMLTDNQCRITDNAPHLLSDNEADLELLSDNNAEILSGNEVPVLSGNTLELLSRLRLLSGIKIFSDIKLDVHIDVQNSGNQGVDHKPKRPTAKKKSRKGHKNKSGRKRQNRAKRSR